MLQPIIPLFINDISKKICEYPVVYREFDVKVAFIETENIIYVHPTVVEEKLGEMLDAMYNFYSTQGKFYLGINFIRDDNVLIMILFTWDKPLY